MASLRRLASAFTVAVALPCGLAGCYNAAEPWRALQVDHVTTTGKIVYVDCGAHGLVVYAFRAGGQEYRGKAAHELLHCQDAKVGDPILVYYSPNSPGIHTSRTPTAQFEHEQGWFLPEVAWLAMLGVWVIIGSVVSPMLMARRKRNATS